MLFSKKIKITKSKLKIKKYLLKKLIKQENNLKRFLEIKISDIKIKKNLKLQKLIYNIIKVLIIYIK
jgi:hypothetical protein